MGVSEGTIVTFALDARLDKNFTVLVRSRVLQENLNDLWFFVVLVFRQAYWNTCGVFAACLLKQELLEELVTSIMAQNIVHILAGSFDLTIKVRVVISNQNPSSMCQIRLSKLLVLLNSFFDWLIPCFVVQACVELFSSISSCYQMQDCIVAIITQHHSITTHIVQESLPVVRGDVCTPIQTTSVNKHNYFFIGDHLCNLHKTVL